MRERRTTWPIGRLLFPGVAACVLLAPNTGVSAGPTNEDPDVALDAGPENEERIVKAVSEEQSQRRAMQNVALKARAKKWTTSFTGTVCETHIMAREMDRLGGQLIIAGEPAGSDLKARAAYLKELVDGAVKDARRIPDMSLKLQRDKKSKMAQAEARARRIPAITSLANRDKWEEAEKNLYNSLDEISAIALWYYVADRAKMLSPFETTRKKIDEEMAKRRTEAAQAAMQSEIEARLPDLDGLVSQVKTAAEAVRSNGMADFGGEMLSGPQLVQRYGQQWKSTMVVLMQCRALNAARAGAPDGNSLQAADDLKDKTAKFSDQMALALVTLIEADAEQVPEQQAREHYLAYLPVVGLLNTLSQKGKLAEVALPALDRLAARSSVLVSEVDAYRAATDDLLRWRRRTTQAYADREEENFPTAKEQLADASSGERSLRDAQKNGLDDFPVWAILETLSPEIIDQPVRAGQLTGLPTGSKKIAVNPFKDRTLVQCAVADHLDAELALLKTELLVDGSSPPLSLAAATALATAERGDLVAVGGNITQVAVDAVITRFRDLSQSLWPLALSEFQNDTATDDHPLEQILFRFTIRPVWLQHEYLFARMEEPPAEEEEPPADEEPPVKE